MPGRCAGKAQLSTFYKELEMAEVKRAVFADVAARVRRCNPGVLSNGKTLET